MDEIHLCGQHQVGSRIRIAPLGQGMKLLVVHEVNYLEKIIYEYQILPEILSILGHEITIIDYDETWRSPGKEQILDLKTRIYSNTHRAYPGASVTVRRPGMIRLPLLARATGA